MYLIAVCRRVQGLQSLVWKQCVLRALAAVFLIATCVFIGMAFDRMVIGGSCSEGAVQYGAIALLCTVGWGICDGFGGYFGFGKSIEVRKQVVDQTHK